jgi:hypothetical protein
VHFTVSRTASSKKSKKEPIRIRSRAQVEIDDHSDHWTTHVILKDVTYLHIHRSTGFLWSGSQYTLALDYTHPITLFYLTNGYMIEIMHDYSISFFFKKSNHRRHLDMQIKWFFYQVNKGGSLRSNLKKMSLILLKVFYMQCYCLGVSKNWKWFGLNEFLCVYRN